MPATPVAPQGWIAEVGPIGVTNYRNTTTEEVSATRPTSLLYGDRPFELLSKDEVFETLLADFGVSPSSEWLPTMKVIVHDTRYKSLPSLADREHAFREFQRKQQRRQICAELAAVFGSLFETHKIGVHTTWAEFTAAAATAGTPVDQAQWPRDWYAEVMGKLRNELVNATTLILREFGELTVESSVSDFKGCLEKASVPLPTPLSAEAFADLVRVEAIKKLKSGSSAAKDTFRKELGKLDLTKSSKLLEVLAAHGSQWAHTTNRLTQVEKEEIFADVCERAAKRRRVSAGELPREPPQDSESERRRAALLAQLDLK
eukprot:TRINITY_DN2735_c0_g1_i1.p1 TRINITY_DN2735_c0_g1~~TRINITY_DN2735_c0_g1_i1.p1  ORF type:complete len:317 (-),score=55.38 TRINITY_DN2735_c0_g1_i1:6-956(-)